MEPRFSNFKLMETKGKRLILMLLVFWKDLGGKWNLVNPSEEWVHGTRTHHLVFKTVALLIVSLIASRKLLSVRLYISPFLSRDSKIRFTMRNLAAGEVRVVYICCEGPNLPLISDFLLVRDYFVIPRFLLLYGMYQNISLVMRACKKSNPRPLKPWAMTYIIVLRKPYTKQWTLIWVRGVKLGEK